MEVRVSMGTSYCVLRSLEIARILEAEFFDEQNADGGERHEDGRHCHGLTVIQTARLREETFDGDGDGWVLGARDEEGRAELAEGNCERECGGGESRAAEDREVNVFPHVERRRAER